MVSAFPIHGATIAQIQFLRVAPKTPQPLINVVTYLGLYFTSVAEGSRCLLVSRDALSSTTGAATIAFPRAVEVSLAPGTGRVSAMLAREV